MRISTSGATDSEYVEMMLASIETYLLDGIARQRDMSKIALQSANGTDCFLNLINRIYKLLYIKVGIYFLGECLLSTKKDVLLRVLQNELCEGGE